MSENVVVEVVFAMPESQLMIEVTMPSGATACEAIEASGLRLQFPDHDLGKSQIGVWGKIVSSDHRLQTGDRVEIYRELTMDPMEARRIRALAPDPDPFERH